MLNGNNRRIRKKKGTKGLFEITMTENVSKLNDPQTQRSRKLRISKMINTKTK